MDTPLPRRPALAPGLRVLERGSEVQVGLDPPRVVLPATDAVRRSLAVIRCAGPADQADPEVLATLHANGVLVDAGRPRAAPTTRVLVQEFGAPLPGVRALLDAAGVLVVDERPDLVLVVGVGEPDRALVDPWVRDAVPHLVLRLTEGVAVVGPFVVPGRTACLRCVDAHHAAADPRWPLLVAQQAVLTSRPRDDALPEPVDPALAAVALGWAVRDLVSHGEDRPPATWSSTLRLPPELVDAEAVAWLRHPECGCWWNAAD